MYVHLSVIFPSPLPLPPSLPLFFALSPCADTYACTRMLLRHKYAILDKTIGIRSEDISSGT